LSKDNAKFSCVCPNTTPAIKTYWELRYIYLHAFLRR